MPEFDQVRIEEKAKKLLQDHGDNAVFQASIQAYTAILIKDIPQCRFWKKVLNALDPQRN